MKRFIPLLISTIIILSLTTLPVFAEYDKYDTEYFSENLFSSIDSETLSVLNELGINDLSYQDIFFCFHI